MHQTRVMPLRETVGDPLPYKSLEVIGHSPEIEPEDIRAVMHGNLAGLINEPIYAEFLPQYVQVEAGAFGPGSGVPVFPPPADLPFNPQMPVGSLAVKGPPAPEDGEDISRRLWVELLITLPSHPTVGGLAFCGYPYLPYYLTFEGGNSANFGLPREVRVSWADQHDAGFLDDEVSVTLQKPVAHSGVHLLSTGRVVTDHLRVRIGDFPRITRFSRQRDPRRFLFAERYGVLMPMIVPWAYREGARFRPRVPGGLLGAYQQGGEWGRSYFFWPNQAMTPPDPRFARACPDALAVESGQYHPMTGASLFAGTSRRLYQLDTPRREHFVSSALDEGDRLRIVFEQTEEHERCLAGLKLRGIEPPRALTREGLVRRARVRVFGLDPDEGVSPLRDAGDLSDDEYATLLDDREVDLTDRETALRFARVSSDRYFVLEIIPREKGRVVLEEIELVQSVRVEIGPRASRHQVVRGLNFRLVGPDLAEDYANLGGPGFSIEVERVAGGEVKEVLYRADCLADLLQAGGARLFANGRRRAVEREVARTEGGYAQTQIRTRSDGWQRTESGAGVAPVATWQIGPRYDPFQVGYSPDGEHGFDQLGHQETRTRTELIGEVDPNFRSLVLSAFGLDLNTPDDRLWTREDSNAIWPAWQGMSGADLASYLSVDGVRNVNIPPYLPGLFAAIRAALISGDLGALGGYVLPSLEELFLVNGISVGVSGAFYIGGSISATVGVPTLVHSASVGTQGQIVRQATDSGYAYAQNLMNSFTRAAQRIDYDTGELTRTIERGVVPERDERVKGAEVRWQGRTLDVLAGRIPLNVPFRATAHSYHPATDEAIRVRLGPGLAPGGRFPPRERPVHLSADVWFDVRTERIRDDH